MNAVSCELPFGNMILLSSKMLNTVQLKDIQEGKERLMKDTNKMCQADFIQM